MKHLTATLLISMGLWSVGTTAEAATLHWGQAPPPIHLPSAQATPPLETIGTPGGEVDAIANPTAPSQPFTLNKNAAASSLAQIVTTEDVEYSLTPDLDNPTGDSFTINLLLLSMTGFGVLWLGKMVFE